VIQLALSYFYSHLPDGATLHGVGAAILRVCHMENAEPVPCSDFQLGLVLLSGQPVPDKNPNEYFRAKGRWWRERLLDAQDAAGVRYFQYVEGKFNASKRKNESGAWILVLPDLVVEALENWIEAGGFDLTPDQQIYAMRDAVRDVVANHRRRDAKLESKLMRKARRERVRNLLKCVERILEEIAGVAAEYRNRGESFYLAGEQIARCVDEQVMLERKGARREE